MGIKRKRTRSSKLVETETNKKLRMGAADTNQGEVHHPTLRLFYQRVSTLREHLLSQLPKTSKKRRRTIAAWGRNASSKDFARRDLYTCERQVQVDRQKAYLDDEDSMTRLLDQTLICSLHEDFAQDSVYHAKDLEAFSQQVTLTVGSSIGEGTCTQSELIDFAIWLLFNKIHQQSFRPSHMLCHGYQRARGSKQSGNDQYTMAGIPGIVPHYPNDNVSILKGAQWNKVLNLLGKDSERVMLNMIICCGIYVMVENGRGNFYQLSGTPMTDLKALVSANSICDASHQKHQSTTRSRDAETIVESAGRPRAPASISFVRSRMLYACAALNAKGKVTFGLHHIHALHRYPDSKNGAHTLRLLQYFFPREFGLHNVFTSSVDPKETTQRFKDYTLREAEIARRERSSKSLRTAGTNVAGPRIPKRLRGRPIEMHYCPWNQRECMNDQRIADENHEINAVEFVTQASNLTKVQNSPAVISQSIARQANPSFFDSATPQANVSAFCRAVLSNLIPDGFWGGDEQGNQNKSIFMHNVDRFVRLRRFELMSLHLVSQELKISTMEWLVPPSINFSAKIAQTDMRKRKEILLEFLYYLFDSLLIPLIRSNFHVTESNVHQNNLFYFRHDVWRTLTEPAMTKIKLDLFEEIKIPEVKTLLDARPLGFSQIRLLPKAAGVRPITNLKRRATQVQNGKVGLGKSINSVMTPVFNILDFERRSQPKLIGSAMFSVGDMFPKLKQFASKLGHTHAPLHFAKADAKSCFDTIPQKQVMKLIAKIISEDEYRIARHSEIKASNSFYYQGSKDAVSKPERKFKATARAPSDFDRFYRVVESSFAWGKKNTVFIDGIVQQSQKAEEMLDLLREHLERNIVKIGKKFFRQKSGIPQGSILSSLLCNYVYAEMEREQFTFVNQEESLFLRLIDDFLIITTNKDHAKRFLQIMHDGVEKYGVSVNPTKTLANFEVVINGHKVPQQCGNGVFPYCGNLIDTQTLEITKDRNRRIETVLANTLTVDRSKVPGRTFYRKALSAFKIQTHKMFLDTNLNSPRTVLLTIYQNFTETAMKSYRYAKSMPTKEQPSPGLVKGTVHDLIDLALVLVQGKHRRHKLDDYECAVSRSQIRWLAGRAFRRVLGQKQTTYGPVIIWLEGLMVDARVGGGRKLERLERIAQEGDAVFGGYQY